MKKKGRHELCKHVLQAFDEVVLVDLDCPQYSLISGTAIVTKQTCKYCPCMEKKKDGKSLESSSKPKAPAGGLCD